MCLCFFCSYVTQLTQLTLSQTSKQLKYLFSLKVRIICDSIYLTWKFINRVFRYFTMSVVRFRTCRCCLKTIGSINDRTHAFCTGGRPYSTYVKERDCSDYKKLLTPCSAECRTIIENYCKSSRRGASGREQICEFSSEPREE